MEFWILIKLILKLFVISKNDDVENLNIDELIKDFRNKQIAKQLDDKETNSFAIQNSRIQL